ncbi:MAG: DUF4167 domain-containing protein [Shimia sp.]
MRQSKSRSRNKNRNNNRPQGNIVNRVFDSSGPEGKVRGTPQQIIDKYQQLFRDAQLSGDRVAAENFAQHSEHYSRMLAEAQREQDAKREEQERQNRERQAERDRERAERQEREGNQGGQQGGQQCGQQGNRGNDRDTDRGDRTDDPGQAPQPDVMDTREDGAGGDSGLVETAEEGGKAEEAPKPKRTRRSRKPKAEAPPQDDSAQAAE